MKLCNALVLLCCVISLSRPLCASAQDAADPEERAFDALKDTAEKDPTVDARQDTAPAEDNAVDSQQETADEDNAADAQQDTAAEDNAADAQQDTATAEDNAVDSQQETAAEDNAADAQQDTAASDAQDAPAVAGEDQDNGAVDAVDVDPLDAQDANDVLANEVDIADAVDVQESPAAPTVSPDTTTSTTPSLKPSAPLEPPSNRSVAAWFRTGVEAYLSEDWKTCATALENALHEWQYFLRANIDCRLSCGREARQQAPLFEKDIDQLQHVEMLVRTTLCIIKCKRRAFRGRVTTDTIAPSDQKALRNLKAYEYLQLCYYQSLQFQKAASAVFTIISHDPTNEIMRQNLKYYLSMPEVDANKLVNYESQPYVPLYRAGTEAYYSENYESAVSNLEKSLQEFLSAIDRCRADCEGPFDQGWQPDFTPSITNHYVYCLKCKTKCHSKLSQMNGENYDDFLPLHYNYLQFAYFKLGRLKDACAAAATYLMFLPADETMLENIEFYKALPKFESSMFQPRSEAVDYIHRQTYEHTLLKFVTDEFIFPDPEENDKPPSSDEISELENKASWEPTDLLQYATLEEEFYTSLNRPFKKGMESKIQQGNLLKEVEIKFDPNLEGHVKDQVDSKELERLKKSVRKPIFNFRAEGDLGGEKRFIVDGLANKLECKQLQDFAKVSGVRGDGYDGNKTPHSPVEIFEGITLGRAALMVHFGLINLSTLHLFLNLSERGRNLTATYFNISSCDLHFSYTHLVCRSAVPGLSENVLPLSHRIHADNCWLRKDGGCEQAAPAYYWRDYSAILYLNDDFNGGDFIFSADPLGKFIQSSIKPTCGRLVGFSAGRENLHGVRGVKRGTRCALALWFTLDKTRSEWGRILTEQMIQYLEAGEQPSQILISELENLVEFDLEEAEKQMLQAASCDNCSEETKRKHSERSASLVKSNHSQH